MSNPLPPPLPSDVLWLAGLELPTTVDPGPAWPYRGAIDLLREKGWLWDSIASWLCAQRAACTAEQVKATWHKSRVDEALGLASVVSKQKSPGRKPGPSGVR